MSILFIKRIVILFFSVIFSVIFLYFISERFFFDKLFYQKSVNHGYWVEGKASDVEDFGERGKDVTYLNNLQEKKIRGSSLFRIAFVSDSYGWGQGVRFNKTVSQELERDLNSFGLKNEVMSFSVSGDSMLDHAAKIDILDRYDRDNIDLYIILLVENDFMLEQSYGRYNSDIYFKIISECSIEYPNENVIREPEWVLDNPNRSEDYNRTFTESLNSNINRCIYEKSLQFINEKTANKSIFLIGDASNEKNNAWKYIISVFDQNNIKYIDSAEGKGMPKYYSCWKNGSSFNKCFFVSKSDLHPSIKLHRMYTDILVNEIVD